MRILVVCGAGASSTFLVLWIRRVCASRGIAADIEPGSIEFLESEIRSVDVVLVGRPLHDAFEDIQAMTDAVGVPAVLMPDSRFGEGTAAEALDLALAALQTPSTAVTPATPVPHLAPEPGRRHD